MSSAIWVTVITGLFSLATTAIGLLNRHKIRQVHVLVNSRLDSTLTEIADLKRQRDLRQGNGGESGEKIHEPGGPG